MKDLNNENRRDLEIMDYNEVWKHKDKNMSNYKLKILGPNPDGSVKITFDFGLTPKRTYNYQKEYLKEVYEYAGYKSSWSLDKSLMDLTPQAPIADVVKDALSEFRTEDILFSDHTGKEKINKFQTLAVKEGEIALTTGE